MKLIIKLSLFLSTFSFASDCTYNLTQWGVNGEHLPDRYVLHKVRPILELKGYQYSPSAEAKFNIHLHYFGMLSSDGRSKTVGTVLSFRQRVNGEKIRLAEVKNERFIGPAVRVSMITLKKNIKDIVDKLPLCENNTE